MAEFHLHGQIIKRSEGRSAVNAAAYRAGEVLYDQRLDQTFDYTRKQEVEESIILGPDHAPEWMLDRQMLWNTVEAVERHKAAQLAREFDIALPIELVKKNPEAAKDALKAWATDMFVEQGLIVDINFHSMKSKNPHAHIMSTMRRVHPQAMEFAEGARYAFESTKARDQNDWGYMDHWRETWADYGNAAMAEHGIDARIDHRTLIEQGITDREPGIHIGPVANAMEARGEATGRWLKNAMIWFDNQEPFFEEDRRYLAFIDEEMKEEGRRAEEAARQAEAERKADAEALGIVAKADELGDLDDRLQRAVRGVVSVATRSIADSSEALDGHIARRLATKADALAVTGGRLATVTSPALLVRKKSIADLGTRLQGAIASAVNGKASRVSMADAGLRGAIVVGISDRNAAVEQQSRSLHRAAGAVVTRGRAKVTAIVGDLHAARPRFRVERGRLGHLASRLEAAAIARVRNQASELQQIARRLETERPTRLTYLLDGVSASTQRLGKAMAEVVRALGRAGRYAGESVSYTMATIAGRRPDESVERQRIVASTSKKEADEPIATPQPTSGVANERQQAEWLLYQLQSLNKNVTRRVRGEPRLDLSLIPARLHEEARTHGVHPMIQAWLDEAEDVQTKRLMDLLNGANPVLKRENGRLVVIPGRIPEALTNFAADKLQYDDVIRLYAEAAIQRWHAPAAGPQVASSQSQLPAGSGAGAASKTAGEVGPQQQAPPPPPLTPYDQAVLEAQRRGGKGISDD